MSVKFGQTCMAVLRNEPLFDLRKCRRHITEIYTHLIKVCQNINFELDKFTDVWSTFTLCHRTKSTFDIITIDKAIVIGASTISSKDDDAYARITYFFYTKILHELAHACLAELGRSLPVEDEDEQFSSPATHGLTGEAGNSIERHFFGSVVDAIGHFTDNAQSIYLIDHIILRER
ncbi:unnamed protein product [Adineta ricciae]|uniref:Uncharacterized protein n=1 Tax=Adineta ricciae TaxID=249248 RepID=A0A816CTV8_ADIRI|nr:unnamed protein product [Adineta ricciae]